MPPDIISDMKYFVDSNIAFHYNPNGTISIPIYQRFMEFVDLHLAIPIVESGKTLVDGQLTRVMLTVDKGTYKVTCELYTSQELLEYQKYCDDKLDDKEMKDDEMRYEAESDAREEGKELLNDESND